MGSRGSSISRPEGDNPTRTGDDTLSRGASHSNQGSNETIILSNNHRIVPLEINSVNSHQNSTAAREAHGPPNLASPHSLLNSSSSEIGIIPSISTPNPSQLLTPRREDNLYNKISYTPIGDQLSVYKYYCPLCMSFYQDIFTSSACCRHYICSECTTDYLIKRNHPVNTLNDILLGSPYHNLACPHCNTVGFSPTLVSPHEGVRNYLDSATPVQQISYPSPMKIGDSFEDMKRKMASISQKSNETGSSKQLLPPSGNRIRQFSPDSDITRCIDPLPFPSLDEHGTESHSNPSSSRANHTENIEPPYCSTPLRGIALNVAPRALDDSMENQIVPQKPPPSMHEIASNFVHHLLRCNPSDQSCDDQWEAEVHDGPIPSLQWISTLFPSPLNLVKRNSKSKVLPFNEEELSSSHPPSTRGTPRFLTSSSTPRTEKEVHEFATLFVNNILLPNQ